VTVRVVITGATGNVGTALVDRLITDDQVSSIVALARRRPTEPATSSKLMWTSADVATDDLRPHVDGADAVVHLAWLFQPTHRPLVTWQANAIGSSRVFDAAVAAGVGAIVHASSVGAYVAGAFNVAAEPVIDADVLADVLGTRPVRAPRALVRAATAVAWRAHLAPADPALLDLVLGLPLLDTRRAHDELGWAPRHSAVEALGELVHGMAHGAGGSTPPLAPQMKRAGRKGAKAATAKRS
jgi:nucleoside-diphosphate-sugar epimerase